jgi:hypothetical protein
MKVRCEPADASSHFFFLFFFSAGSPDAAAAHLPHATLFFLCFFWLPLQPVTHLPHATFFFFVGFADAAAAHLFDARSARGPRV